MAYVSKRYRAAVATPGYEKHKRYDIGSALGVLAEFPKPKFDETVELAVRLGIDPKKSDQMVRGSISMPKGIGKTRSVIVFAEGVIAEEAEEAGALEVGGEELAKKIQGGWFDFDVVIAHPAMMRVVGRLGKLLGPKKLMPNPKEGSVTPRVAQAVKEFSGGKAKYRADDKGNLHVGFGKRSFSDEMLVENLMGLFTHLQGVRPTTSRGTFIQAAYIASTMSPGVGVDVVVAPRIRGGECAARKDEFDEVVGGSDPG